MSKTISKTSHWATTYNCTDTGDWSVTQGQADYCEEYGHAFYMVEGVMRETCPRCGTHTKFDPQND